MSHKYARDQNGKYKLSKDEALYVRDEMSRTRDFWIYDMDSNKELLQAALDVLQNSIEGNYYYVDYMDSQNGCRLIIYCDPCNKSLSSYDPFMSHDQGKAHKKAVQLKINKREAEKVSQQEIHYKALNSSKNIFDPDSLEDILDRCQGKILGLQFVFKERLHGYDSSFRYSCQMCDLVRQSQQEMFFHLAEDDAHNRRYLMVKFDRRVTTADNYKIKCEEIEMLEGKVNHTFTDFTEQYKTIRSAHGGTPPATPSPPPSPTSRTSRSPDRNRLLTPPPPLVTDQEVQVDADELDMDLPLKKEVSLIKINDGDHIISKDKEAVELLMETLQTLNLKMHAFYAKTSRNHMQNTGKYQSYLSELHKLMQNNFE